MVTGIQTPYPPAGRVASGLGNAASVARNNNNAGVQRPLFSSGYGSAGTAPGTVEQTLKHLGAGGYSGHGVTPGLMIPPLIADTYTPPKNREDTPVGATVGDGEFIMSDIVNRFYN